MKKASWIKFIVGVVLVFAITPIFVNWLMFKGNFKVAGTSDTWIAFLGSFWGAIIGGIISGTLTLLGVYLTITRQRETEFENKYPQMALKGNKIEERFSKAVLILRSQNPKDNFPEKSLYKQSIRTHLVNLREESDQVIEWAAGISADCFENTSTFYNNIKEMLREIDSSYYYDEIGNLIYPSGAINVDMYLNIMNDIQKNHNFFMREISNRFYKNR